MERSFPSTGAGHALAAALLADGDPAGAVEALVEAGGGDELRADPRRVAGVRARAADPLRARARPPRGRRAGGRAGAGVGRRRSACSSACAMADRAQAAVALAAGEHDEAARLALRSAAAFADGRGAGAGGALARRSPARPSAPRATPIGRPRSSTRAATEFELHGAFGQRDAAERELRRLGRRSRYRRTRAVGDGSLVESLTERELQVARLVVDRRTNAEIAAELYLSTKTVETHLRNLFHKLGVSSRVEVARVIERADASAAAAVSSGAPGRARSGAG